MYIALKWNLPFELFSCCLYFVVSCVSFMTISVDSIFTHVYPKDLNTVYILIYSVLYNWTLILPAELPLKKAIDHVLCSMCYINSTLFPSLLQRMGILIPNVCTGRNSSVSDDRYVLHIGTYCVFLVTIVVFSFNVLKRNHTFTSRCFRYTIYFSIHFFTFLTYHVLFKGCVRHVTLDVIQIYFSVICFSLH